MIWDPQADRRSDKRFDTEHDIEWESSAGRFEGVLSDISAHGCYILSSGRVSDGQTVCIFIPIGDAQNLELRGAVANSTPDIGFAVRFDEVSEMNRELIGRLAGA